MDNKINNDIILYTTEDIQNIFNCGKRQMYQIVNSSGFPKIQIGRKFYIPKDRFEKWVNGNVGRIINT